MCCNCSKCWGQKESGSCPAVVVEGVEVCGGRLGCVAVVKVWVTVRWHV